MTGDWRDVAGDGYIRVGTADEVYQPNPVLWRSQQRALETQVGGDHYKTMKIQPIEFIMANELGWCEGNVIKYICRWKQKGGAKDLEKVIHYAQILLESLNETSDRGA